ncbi:MAG: hypothetical protein Q9163_002188 [Psora crenata]
MVIAFGTADANSTTSWQGEPDGRGTWSLLTSSLITIALCAWTALHLNIPEHGKGNRQWLRKTKWLVMGVVAPEMVAYIAWRQRKEAKAIVSEVKRVLVQDVPPPPPYPRAKRWLQKLSWTRRAQSVEQHNHIIQSAAPEPASPKVQGLRRPQWTLVHGFYVAMGGFAFSTTTTGSIVGARPGFLPHDRTRATITPEGLRFLLDHEPSALPSISADEILDKSKADGVKKTLVCAQAGWFCASCITRLANGLPISLLELNAMAHALCALVIYMMWWCKPLDVLEPTVIEVGGGEGQEEVGLKGLASYMWMGSDISAQGLRAWDVSGKLIDEFDAIWLLGLARVEDLVFGQDPTCRHDGTPLEVAAPSSSPRSAAPAAAPPPPLTSAIDPYAYAREESRRYPPTSLSFRKWHFLHRFFALRLPPGLGHRHTAIDHLSLTTVERWRLAHSAIHRYALLDDLRTRHGNRLGLPFHDDGSRLKDRIPNHVSIFGSFRFFDVWMGFAAAGITYGGLHLLAWNAPFQTPLEAVLWRIASCSLICTPLILAPVILLPELRVLKEGALEVVRIVRGRKEKEKEKEQQRYPHGRKKVEALWAKTALALILLPVLAASPLLWFLYVFGRWFLVVECFRNVGNLPKGVYKGVGWPGYLPHIA